MPEMDVPAGFTQISYNPQYVLAPEKEAFPGGDRTGGISHAAYAAQRDVLGGPGGDASGIKAASAYEARTHHRKPPAAFGPVTKKTSTNDGIHELALTHIHEDGAWSVGTCDEADFAFRDLRKRFDHEFLLACLHSGLQIREEIAPKHRHPALTHDSARVVLSIYQVNRHTGFRLAGLKYCLEHPISIHPRSAESRQEGRVSVEDSAFERLEYKGSQFLHVTHEEHDVDVSRHQNAANRRVQRGRLLVRFRRQMNGLHTGLASPPQGARVAIVAHDNRDAPLNAATVKSIQQALKRRALMRGENSKVHGSQATAPAEDTAGGNFRLT
jgi:hypothetical protein